VSSFFEAKVFSKIIVVVAEIGHFKSYAGRRYRIYLEFSKEGFAGMRIAFVTHPDTISELREKIIYFLENNR